MGTRKTSFTAESMKDVAKDISSLNIKIQARAKKIIDEAKGVRTESKSETSHDKPENINKEKSIKKDIESTSQQNESAAVIYDKKSDKKSTEIESKKVDIILENTSEAISSAKQKTK